MLINVGNGRVLLGHEKPSADESYVNITLSDKHVSTTVTMTCAQAAQLGEAIMRWAAKQGELKVAP